jgi:hypothetical protein
LRSGIDRVIAEANSMEANAIRSMVSEHITFKQYDDYVKQLVIDMTMFDQEVNVGGRKMLLGRAIKEYSGTQFDFSWTNDLIKSKVFGGRKGNQHMLSALSNRKFQIAIGTHSFGPATQRANLDKLASNPGYVKILEFIDALNSEVGEDAFSFTINPYEHTAESGWVQPRKLIDLPGGKAASVLTEMDPWLSGKGFDIIGGYGDVKPNFVPAIATMTDALIKNEMRDLDILYRNPQTLLEMKATNPAYIEGLKRRSMDIEEAMINLTLSIDDTGKVDIGSDILGMIDTMYEEGYVKQLRENGIEPAMSRQQFLKHFISIHPTTKQMWFTSMSPFATTERTFNVPTGGVEISAREIQAFLMGVGGIEDIVGFIDQDTETTKNFMAMLHSVVRQSFQYTNPEELVSMLPDRYKNAPHIFVDDFLDQNSQSDQDAIKRLSKIMGEQESVVVFGAQQKQVISLVERVKAELGINAFGFHTEDTPGVQGIAMSTGTQVADARAKAETAGRELGIDANLMRKMDVSTIMANIFKIQSDRSGRYVSPNLSVNTLYDKIAEEARNVAKWSSKEMKGRWGWAVIGVGALMALSSINRARGESQMENLDSDDTHKQTQLYRLTREGYGYDRMGLGSRMLPSTDVSHRLNIPQVSEIIINENETIDKDKLEEYMVDHMNLGYDWVG